MKICITLLIKLFLLTGLSVPAKSQIEIERDDFTVELGGRLITYYNYRFYESWEEDRSKNRFRQRDARFVMEGEYGDIEFELKYDFAAPLHEDIAPEDHPVKDAYLIYSGVNLFDIKMGLSKLPYSRTSMVSFRRQPFNQRAGFARGEVFSRRDVGIMLHNSHWDNRINWYAGTYTGLGIYSIGGDNDRSGTLEYLGRIDIAYPDRYRQRELDLEYTETPGVQIGINARYAEKGETIDLNYGLFTIDGSKLTYGADISFRYRGFSAQLEGHQIRAKPNDTMRFQGYDTDHFKAGGYLAQLNYVIRPINTYVAVRYDEFNPNDLIFGNTKSNLSFALGYLINDQKTYIKAHYWHRLPQEFSGRPWQQDQFRISFVHDFF